MGEQVDTTPADKVTSYLAGAFQQRPGWVVKDRQAVPSFQQSMERVLLEWPEAGATEEVFVRVYRGYMSWWTLVAPDLPQREQAAMRVASRAGIPVPRILYAEQSPDEAVTVLQRVFGEAWVAPRTADVAVHLAETLGRLHRAPIRDEDRKHLPDISLPALLPRFARWAEEAGDASQRDSVDVMAARLAEVDERPPGLVHGDCHLGNILFDGEAITAVIDWEEAALGDPRVDVMLIRGWLRRNSPELEEPFLCAYEAEAGYPLGPLDIWRDLTNLRSQIMSAWVKNSLAQGRVLPSANPEVWIE
jgi:aminoglycoside phosphotransferase (APT) family kinase protein